MSKKRDLLLQLVGKRVTLSYSHNTSSYRIFTPPNPSEDVFTVAEVADDMIHLTNRQGAVYEEEANITDQWIGLEWISDICQVKP
jgi:hypothetical protein